MTMTLHSVGLDATWQAACTAWQAQRPQSAYLPLDDLGALPRMPQAAQLVVLLTDPHHLTPDARARVQQWQELMPDLVHLTIWHEVHEPLTAWYAAAADIVVARDATADALAMRMAIAVARRQHTLDGAARVESQMTHLVQQSADGVLVCDPMQMVYYVNPAAEALLETPADRLIGRQCAVPYDLQRATTWSVERQDGTRRTLAIHAVDVQWDAMPGVLVTCHDVTEVEQLLQMQAHVEERERLDQQKDQFLHTVAHEVRGPLAVMQASLSNLLACTVGPLTPEQQKVLAIAQRNIDRMTRMLNGLLSLARLESTGTQLTWHPVELRHLCDDVVAAATALAATRGVQITLHADAASEVCAGDGDLLTQLLTNIVSNGVRFATSRVDVRLGCAPAMVSGPRMLAIEISDDGPGIPGPDPMVVFDRFTQLARPAQAGEYKGTGLGLAICRDIVERHRGVIWADNRPDGGARFTVWLPQWQSAHPVWALVDAAIQQVQAGRPTGIVAVLLRRPRVGGAVAAVWAQVAQCVADVGLPALRRGDHGEVDAALGAFVCQVAGTPNELWIVANRLQQRFGQWATVQASALQWDVHVVPLSVEATAPAVLSQLFTPEGSS